MRTLWKGAINFGLINIAVRLITATSKNKFRRCIDFIDCVDNGSGGVMYGILSHV